MMQDIATDVFRELRVTAARYGWLSRPAPWTLHASGEDSIRFYGVLAGECWLQPRGQPRQTLGAGTLVVLPHREAHSLGSGFGPSALPAEPNWDLERLACSGVRSLVVEAQAQSVPLLVTGHLTIERAHQQHWWGMLPPSIAARASTESLAWLEATLGFIASESLSSRPGTNSLVSRLSDLLVMQVLRRHTESLEGKQPEATSWLAALAEPQIGASLALLHAEIAHAWTVESLARKVGMSRSAFAARFTRLVGQPPLYYLTCVRMQQAACLLRDTNIASAEVAERVGYVSDTAFCKAFKRSFGQSPGAYRRQQRTLPTPEAA